MSHDQDRAAALAATWTTELRRTGRIQARFDTDDERELYRHAGRKAGRLLQRPVRTLVISDEVHVLLTDWMDRPLERQLEHARTRNAIDRAFTVADQPAPEAPTPAPVTPLRRPPRSDR
jgi:hypothetical protein